MHTSWCNLIVSDSYCFVSMMVFQLCVLKVHGIKRVVFNNMKWLALSRSHWCFFLVKKSNMNLDFIEIFKYFGLL